MGAAPVQRWITSQTAGSCGCYAACHRADAARTNAETEAGNVSLSREPPMSSAASGGRTVGLVTEEDF